MRGTVNSKVMSGSKLELNWKGAKGKRTRKAVPRRFNGVTKSENSSPKRVVDFSGSDSDKLAASSVIGQRKSCKSEHVPIKKRRHLLGSLASPPSPSLAGVDDLARAVYDKEFNIGTRSMRVKEESSSWDFSGIELLAAAATMEVFVDNAKMDRDVGNHSNPGSSDASVVSKSKLGLKCNESGNSSSTTTTCADKANCSVLNKCAAKSLSPCVSSKVDRRFWDLNTDMEAWVEPVDDSNTHVEGLKENSEELPNPVVIGVESFALKLKDKLGDAPDRTSCSKSTSLDECLVKPEKISETPNQAIKQDVDVDENKSYQVVCGDADAETAGQAIRVDAILDDVQTTIQGTEITGTAVSAFKIATACIAYKNEKYTQNSYELQGNMTSLRKTISYITCKKEYDEPDEANCLSSVSKSGSFLASGTITKDEKCVDSTSQSDKTCVTGLMIAESHSEPKLEKLFAKHEDDDLPNEGLRRIKLDSCNSYSTRPHDDLAASVGKVDNYTMDPCPDSPYEDGELRGSFSYAWEENDLETELVDYESDGRKENSSDAADNIGSEVVEGGSEGSHGTEGNGEKKNAVKYPMRRNITKDDSKNNETSGKKESDGGSGTTVDHSMGMAINENNDLARRRYLTNRSGMDDCKALMGEYVSRMAREKLQSRAEAADDKDAFFLPQYRSRHLGGFRDRDVTPEKYVGKYTPASYRGGRDGVNQWNSWGSRSRYTSTYQGNEGFNAARPRRSFTGDTVDKFDGLDFHEQRQTGDYLSRDMHRPFARTRSPVERDNRFSMPPARRINSYRSSAHYPQSGDFESVPNGPAAPVRFSRMPGRERSFSPNSVKDGHMPLNRRRSRSRSRTRSPRAWHSYREASFGNRRHIGSPDFRSEARMERVPYHKPKFTPEYREGYVSPPRGRFPSQRNSRWVGDRSFGENHDRSFGDNHFKRRRSPTGGFRFNNQSGNSSGRFKSDEYYRPMNRPRRFSFAENDDREAKFETMYDDEKLENKGEMHQEKQRDNVGNFKRFQRDMSSDFETRNLNNEEGEEGVRAPVLTDVALVQGGGEDKKESENLT